MRLSAQVCFLSHWLRVRDVYVFSGPSDESSQRTRGIWRGACPWKREADNTNRRAWISWVAYIFGPEYTAVCAAYRDWRDRIINRMTTENCVDCAMTMVIYRWAECRVTWRGASRKRVGRGQGRRGGKNARGCAGQCAGGAATGGLTLRLHLARELRLGLGGAPKTGGGP